MNRNEYCNNYYDCYTVALVIKTTVDGSSWYFTTTTDRVLIMNMEIKGNTVVAWVCHFYQLSTIYQPQMMTNTHQWLSSF